MSAHNLHTYTIEELEYFIDNNYKNSQLAAHRHSILEAEMIAALKQDAEEPKYQAGVAVCDSAAGDGIDAAVI